MTSEAQSTVGRAVKERTDLCGQYRPIGIGAVAAALTATGKDSADGTQSAVDSNGSRNTRERIAA